MIVVIDDIQIFERSDIEEIVDEALTEDLLDKIKKDIERYTDNFLCKKVKKEIITQNKEYITAQIRIYIFEELQEWKKQYFEDIKQLEAEINILKKKIR